MDLFKNWLVEKYIAHRGYHNEIAPENSLSAFKLACEKGYAIELDIQQISDGTIVVFHDDSLQRLTGLDGYVKNLTKKDLKKTMFLGTEECIPTLEEVLKTVSGKTQLLIEIKNLNKVGDFESAVLDILKKYDGEYAIQSFNPYVLTWFKEHAPEIPRGQLSSFLKHEKLGLIKKAILKRMMFNRITDPDFISYDARNLPNRFVRKYKHLPLLAWTVRSQDEYMRVVKHCDNIIFENFDPQI